MQIEKLLNKEKKLNKQVKLLTNKVTPIFLRLKRLEKRHEETTNQIDWWIVGEEQKENRKKQIKYGHNVDIII